MAKNYIDIRIHFRKDVEEFDGETFTYFHPESAERIKLKGITEDDLDGIGEHFAQMDSGQDFLTQDIPNAICD